MATKTTTAKSSKGASKAQSNGKATGKAPSAPAKGKGKATATPAPRPRKEGLRKPQIDILRALSKSKRPLTRPQIAAASEVDPTKIGDYAGPRPADRTAAAKARYPFPDLTELGYVKAQSSRPATDGGRTVFEYTITASGKAALVKADKDAAQKAKGG